MTGIGDAQEGLSKELAVAQTLLDEGRAADALARLGSLADQHPESAAVRNKLGVAYARLGRWDEAVEAFERALEADPAMVAAITNLGNVRFEQGRLDEAEEAYRRALALDPFYAAAHNNLAAVLKRTGRIGEAVAQMKEAARLDRDAAGRESSATVRAGRRFGVYVILGLMALAYWLWSRSKRLPSWMLVIVLGSACFVPGVATASAAAEGAAELPAVDAQEGRVTGEAVLPEGSRVAGLSVAGMPLSTAGEYVRAFAQGLMLDPIILRAPSYELRITPAELGIGADVAGMLEEVGRALAGGKVPDARLRLTGPDPQAFDRLAVRLDQDLMWPAVEARVHVTPDGRPELVPSRPGRRVDRAALRAAVLELTPAVRMRGVVVSFEPVAPEVTESDLDDLSALALMGSYSTQLDRSQADRTVNVDLAARALDGLVIKPGAVFSFNDRVGPRIQERGYRQAPVLLDGRFAIGVGGGVCQVSTTLYNAALLAGLQPQSRAPHSLPVWYVALGRDAAVAYGLLDLRIVNPAPSHVVLSAWLDGDRLTVQVWGPARRRALVWRLRTVVEAAETAQTVTLFDPAMPAGLRSIEEPARTGYVASVWRELPLYGPFAARERINTSTYAPRQGIVLVGTGAPVPDPAREPEGKVRDAVNSDSHTLR